MERDAAIGGPVGVTGTDSRVRPLETGRERPKRSRRGPTWALVGALAAAGLLVGLVVGGSWTPTAGESVTTTEPTATTTTVTRQPRTVTPVLAPPAGGYTVTPFGGMEWRAEILGDWVDYVPVRPVAVPVGSVPLGFFVDSTGWVSTTGTDWTVLDPPLRECPGADVVVTHLGLMTIGTVPTEQPAGFILQAPGACLLGGDGSWQPIGFSGDPSALAIAGGFGAHTNTVTLLQGGPSLWSLGDDLVLVPLDDLPIELRAGWDLPSIWAFQDRFLALGRTAGDDGGYSWWTSDDGRTWAAVPDLPDRLFDESVRFAVSDGRVVLAIQDPGRRVFVSEDGITWTATGDPFATDDVHLAGGQPGFVATESTAEEGPQVWMSRDATRWTRLPPDLFRIGVTSGASTSHWMDHRALVARDRVVVYAAVRVVTATTVTTTWVVWEGKVTA